MQCGTALQLGKLAASHWLLSFSDAAGAGHVDCPSVIKCSR
jgi:hypothetical protein